MENGLPELYWFTRAQLSIRSLFPISQQDESYGRKLTFRCRRVSNQNNFGYGDELAAASTSD